MSAERNHPDQILDRAVAEIRADELDAVATGQAAARVWANVSRSVSAEAGASATLRTCADFRSRMPAYLAKQAPDAQVWLLEDHVHGCPACRGALNTMRSGKVVELGPRAGRSRFASPFAKWALAAALVVGIGFGAWQGRDQLLPAPGGPRGVVQSARGVLYRVSDMGNFPIQVGAELGEREEILTARGAGATVRLADGSLVEIRERSDLSLSRKYSGTTIHLERGSVIVQAAKQRTGRLYVATNDCLVSVKGTVFAVDRGTKGSRVSVFQGEVQVDRASQTELLHPGQQVATDVTMLPVPIKDEIAWSQNPDQYLALLGEFAIMQKQLEQVPGPGLRYSSKLLDLAPDGTVLYVAIPNIGGMLGDAQRIFEERLNQSAVLRDWWNRQQSQAKLQQVLDTVRGFSGYLGNEVVMTMAQGGPDGLHTPVAMAEVTGSGFREYLQRQVAQISGGAGLTVVEDLANLPAAGNQHGAFVLLMNNVVVVSPDPANLRVVGALIRQPGSGAFSKTAFYQRIADSYRAGAAWLICADMEQILPSSVQQNERRKAEPRAAHTDNAMLSQLGVLDMQHLVVERKETGGKTENRATVTFAQPRRGVAAWLASPAPMGALDFISPDASFVTAFVVKQPRAALQELFGVLQATDSSFANGLASFEAQAGISVLDDLAGPLGGEVAFAVDGPILPVPGWKFAIEVYDSARLEHTIETLIAKVNSVHQGANVNLTQAQVGGRIYHSLQSPQSLVGVHYTFVDGYLVAAASPALLGQAISQRATGFTLTRSAGFRALLGRDGYSNFSAILYQNFSKVSGPLAGTLSATGVLTPEQQKALDTLKANVAPTLIYVYGQPDRIEVASTGSFFGVNLDALAGTGGPFQIPNVLEKTLRMRPVQ
ncbi:MAG TPA: FecR domain-containing protein [Bryobacteraceae bacterium]|nr:FecR domain-containing protein [Bryobacteraceae bacterium]